MACRQNYRRLEPVCSWEKSLSGPVFTWPKVIMSGDFSLSATLFEFRNVSLPKTVSSSDDSSDPLAWEAKVLERIGMSEEAMHTIDELFRMFIKLRISSGWLYEKDALKAWIAKGAEN
jgi:hypothetical protein